MPRIAWFTPLPPVRSGIARYNRELLPSLAHVHQIDLFVDGRPEDVSAPDAGMRVFSAYDFAWRERERPYDLVVYQLGNAPCHDYMWAYLVRYPGLTVLHDGQLHHARGRMLLQRWQPRQDDYRNEFWFNHPDARKGIADLGAAGLLGSLTYLWPMLRVAVESSRHLLVHNEWLAGDIRESYPGAAVTVVEMGVPAPAPRADARQRIRTRHGIPDDVILFTAFGKITPEKRVREALRAIAEIVEHAPNVHLLLAGEAVEYYDMAREASRAGIDERLTIAGYVDDDEMDDYLTASDVCVCTRWPTSRETSASWLRCLAAGKPTIFTDLVHTADIPAFDPRSWKIQAGTAPVGVSIDILDEAHSLKLAMRRLVTDEKLRSALGANAGRLWAERFQLEGMAAGYQEAIERALQAQRPGVRGNLPSHLRSDGTEHAGSLVKEITGSEYYLHDAD